MSDRVVEAWRARAATEYPSDLADHARGVRLTLLTALCHCRRAEITDGLVDLLIALVHKVKTRAEHRVEEELVADLRRVRDKQQILFRLAEAAPARPDETVRDVVREVDADETHFRDRVRTVLCSSYSKPYRRMLPRLLEVLEDPGRAAAHAAAARPAAVVSRELADFCADADIVVAYNGAELDFEELGRAFDAAGIPRLEAAHVDGLSMAYCW